MLFSMMQIFVLFQHAYSIFRKDVCLKKELFLFLSKNRLRFKYSRRVTVHNVSKKPHVCFKIPFEETNMPHALQRHVLCVYIFVRAGNKPATTETPFQDCIKNTCSTSSTKPIKTCKMKQSTVRCIRRVCDSKTHFELPCKLSFANTKFVYATRSWANGGFLSISFPVLPISSQPWSACKHQTIAKH